MERTIEIVIYLLSFGLCLWALSGLDFGKILRKGQSLKAWWVLLLTSIGLAYLVGKFLMMLINR